MTIETYNDTQTLMEQFADIFNARVAKYFQTATNDTSDSAKIKQFISQELQINLEVDTLPKINWKQNFFNETAGYAFSNLAPVYATPVWDSQADIVFSPQIFVVFSEIQINQSDLPLRNYKLTKQMSCRLLPSHVPTGIPQLKSLAQKVHNAFFTGTTPMSYTSGLTTYRYSDPTNGYRLSIDCGSLVTAEKLINAMLSIQGLELNTGNLSTIQRNKPTAQQLLVLGKEVNKPTFGRIGKLYFRQAQYHQKGIAPRILVNNAGQIPF